MVKSRLKRLFNVTNALKKGLSWTAERKKQAMDTRNRPIAKQGSSGVVVV